MTRGIKLLLQVKHSMIDTGFMLSADRHIDLAYAVVEAGIYGTMGRKAWHFALTSGDVAEATMPMYRKVERDDPQKGSLVKYVPRVSPQEIRGSYNGLLFALEAMVDMGKRDDEKSPASARATVEKTGIRPVVTEVAPEAGAGSGDTASTSIQRAEEPVGEVVRLSDGSLLEVIEWENITAEEFAAAVGGVPRLDTEQVVSNDDPGNGNG